MAAALPFRSVTLIDLIERRFRSWPLDCMPRLARVLQLDELSLCRFALREEHPMYYGALFNGEPPVPTPTEKK